MKEIARSEALTTVLMKIRVFWNGKQRRLVHNFLCFEECFSCIYIYIYLKGQTFQWNAKGATFLRNVCKYLPVDTV